MKKLIAITLSVIFLLLLAACGAQNTPPTPAQKSTVEIAGLKGATTIGMVKLMNDAENGTATHNYNVSMFGTPDEIVPKLISGEIPIAAIPANLASVLYNTSGGKVQVAAINTLGALYVVEIGDTIHSIEDLRGKPLYSTGKGTTPEFALNYILTQNGINPEADVTIEYLSESTEIAANLQAANAGIAVLPQPYIATVMAQNPALRIALSLNDEWDKVSTGSGMVTGVLVANSQWVQSNPDLFRDFLSDYETSLNWVLQNNDEAAQLIAKYGIVPKAEIALTALPYLNLAYISGGEMKTILEGYLQVLYNQMPQAVGGAMPADDFYFEG